MSETTKGKKTPRRKGAGKKRADEDVMICKVYRILTPLSLDNVKSFDGYSSSESFATTEKKLSEACMGKFGGGDYVALQLSESGEGDPLSYWVIKVRDRDRHSSMRVYPREDLISVIRERLRPPSLDDFLYRRDLAAIASLCLKELEEPKTKESKETLAVKMAKELIKQGKSRDEVLRRLMARAKKLWGEKIASDPNKKIVETNANVAYESAKRAERKRGTQRKAIKTGRKTRRT